MQYKNGLVLSTTVALKVKERQTASFILYCAQNIYTTWNKINISLKGSQSCLRVSGDGMNVSLGSDGLVV